MSNYVHYREPLVDIAFEKIPSLNQSLVGGYKVLAMCLPLCEVLFFHVNISYNDLMTIYHSRRLLGGLGYLLGLYSALVN